MRKLCMVEPVHFKIIQKFQFCDLLDKRLVKSTYNVEDVTVLVGT